jgi:hypothetical protein
MTCYGHVRPIQSLWPVGYDGCLGPEWSDGIGSGTDYEGTEGLCASVSACASSSGTLTLYWVSAGPGDAPPPTTPQRFKITSEASIAGYSDTGEWYDFTPQAGRRQTA